MFPDLARDDVFRLETARLWLRWPRAADAPAIHRYCSRWEVAQIHRPHSPSLSRRARRAVHLRRARRQRLGPRPDAGDDPDPRQARGDRRHQPRRREAQDRLTLGYALAPEAWGKGLASEAVEAMVEAGFALTDAIEIVASVRVENSASRRVIEKAGFQFSGRACRARRRAAAWSRAIASPDPRGLGARRAALARRPPSANGKAP